MKNKRPDARHIITDHAVLRYLQRAAGIDAEKLREWMADQAWPKILAGATRFQIGDLRAKVRGGRVVTVLYRGDEDSSCAHEGETYANAKERDATERGSVTRHATVTDE